MKKTLIFSVIPTIIFIFLVSITAPVPPVYAAPCRSQSSITLFPRWFDNLCETGTDTIMPPVDIDASGSTGEQFGKWLSIIGLNIVQMILYIVGYVSLFFIVWGGFKYMTQGDNSSGIAAARKTIQNAVIGLIISILSVAIVSFVGANIK